MVGRNPLSLGRAQLKEQPTVTYPNGGTKEGDEGPGLIGLINGDAGPRPSFEDGGLREGLPRDLSVVSQSSWRKIGGLGKQRCGVSWRAWLEMPADK